MAEHPTARTSVPAQMAATPWESELTARIGSHFQMVELSFATYLGQNFITCGAAAVAVLVRYLHEAEAFDFLVDLTVIDHPKDEKRFELVYILYSFHANERIRIKTRLAEVEAVPTITASFLGANWLEREAFDMFGVTFEGHPNLKRILMPEDWNGFPLRKDASIIGMDKDWVRTHLEIESGQ